MHPTYSNNEETLDNLLNLVYTENKSEWERFCMYLLHGTWNETYKWYKGNGLFSVLASEYNKDTKESIDISKEN